MTGGAGDGELCGMTGVGVMAVAGDGPDAAGNGEGGDGGATAAGGAGIGAGGGTAGGDGAGTAVTAGFAGAGG